MTLKLDIVTPQGIVFSDDVDMVSLPGVDGEIAVLPHHVRLFTQLVPGEITISENGHKRYLAVGEGLVDITGTHVAILTDMAIAAEHIDEARVEEARARAAARLRDRISDEEVASVNASLARLLAQLQVRQRRKA